MNAIDSSASDPIGTTPATDRAATASEPTRGARLCCFLLMIGWALCALGCGTPPQHQNSSTPPLDAWPQWRGPDRDGTIEVEALANADWASRPPREVWRRPLGSGFSSPTVVDRRIVTLFAEHGQEVLIALDLADGSELWRHAMGPALRDSYGSGPRSTPALVDGTVFALSSLGRLAAVRAADGQEIWSRQLIEPPTWGHASSPLIWQELLIVHGRSSGEQAILAFDAASGAIRWSVDAEHPGYASPLAVEVEGTPQIVSFIGDAVLGLDPHHGSVLWRYPWRTPYSVNAADPIFLSPDRLFISSAYLTGAALLQLQAESGELEIEELWHNREMRNHFSSSVVVGRFLYGFDNALLKCLDLASGEVRWRERGLGKGSLIGVGDRLLLLSDDGTLHLAAADAGSFVGLGQIDVLSGRTWTPPVVVGSWAILRDHQEIVALDLG